MPLYSYRCSSDHAFDKLLPLAALERSKTVPCPECGGEAKRVLAGFADRNPSKTKSNMPHPPRKKYTNW